MSNQTRDEIMAELARLVKANDDERATVLEKSPFVGAYAMRTSIEMHDFFHKHRHIICGLEKPATADRK